MNILETHSSRIRVKEIYSLNQKLTQFENVYGEYLPDLGFKWKEKNIWKRRDDLKGLELRGLMLDDPGYLEIDPSITSFSDRNIDKVPWTGIFAEIFESLAKSLNFTFTLKSSRDGEWGSFNRDTGEWNGAIKDLVDGVADVAPISLYVTQIRSTAVDFATPITKSFNVFVVSSKQTYSWDIFTKPFHSLTWLILYIMIFCIGLFFTAVSRIGREDKINEFRLRKCLTFVYGAFCALAARRWSLTPVKISGRYIICHIIVFLLEYNI